MLNREFKETIIHHNQLSYRMRNEPSYAKKVLASLQQYHKEIVNN